MGILDKFFTLFESPKRPESNRSGEGPAFLKVFKINNRNLYLVGDIRGPAIPLSEKMRGLELAKYNQYWRKRFEKRPATIFIEGSSSASHPYDTQGIARAVFELTTDPNIVVKDTGKLGITSAISSFKTALYNLYGLQKRLEREYVTLGAYPAAYKALHGDVTFSDMNPNFMGVVRQRIQDAHVQSEDKLSKLQLDNFYNNMILYLRNLENKALDPKDKNELRRIKLKMSAELTSFRRFCREYHLRDDSILIDGIIDAMLKDESFKPLSKMLINFNTMLNLAVYGKAVSQLDRFLADNDSGDLFIFTSFDVAELIQNQLQRMPNVVDIYSSPEIENDIRARNFAEFKKMLESADIHLSIDEAISSEYEASEDQSNSIKYQ